MIADATPPPLSTKTNDPTIGTWLKTGDGDNRHTVRQVISQLPRKVRLEKKEQMQHRVDIRQLRLHPLAFYPVEEGLALRNAWRRDRQGR